MPRLRATIGDKNEGNRCYAICKPCFNLVDCVGVRRIGRNLRIHRWGKRNRISSQTDNISVESRCQADSCNGIGPPTNRRPRTLHRILFQISRYGPSGTLTLVNRHWVASRLNPGLTGTVGLSRNLHQGRHVRIPGERLSHSIRMGRRSESHRPRRRMKPKRIRSIQRHQRRIIPCN